jgi:FHA domain
MATAQQGLEADPLARHTLSPRALKELLTAERQGEPFIAVRAEDGELDLFVLGRGSRKLAIGRSEEADLELGWDAEVSGLHAELECIAGEWTIIDDGLSTNGTFVNERRVSGRQRLRDGDRVRVGATVLAFKAGDAPANGKTAAARKGPALPPLTDTQRRVLIALCRPYRDGAEFAVPATNQEIAQEVCLGVDAVKMNLRTLSARLGLDGLPQNHKRARLAEAVLQSGLISRRDLEQ